MSETVVIGLGNEILGDDGVGVHAVRRLRVGGRLAAEVELVEGGIAGLLLTPLLADARRAIIVDAIDIGAPPGSLVRLTGRDWSRWTASWTRSPMTWAAGDSPTTRPRARRPGPERRSHGAVSWSRCEVVG